MMPNGQRCKVTSLWRDDEEVQACGPGENLKVRLAGIEDTDVRTPQLHVFSATACVCHTVHASLLAMPAALRLRDAACQWELRVKLVATALAVHET